MLIKQYKKYCKCSKTFGRDCIFSIETLRSLVDVGNFLKNSCGIRRRTLYNFDFVRFINAFLHQLNSKADAPLFSIFLVC